MTTGIAVRFAAQQRAPMAAAIDHDVDAAFHVTIEDDRRLTDVGGAEITWLRDFRLEPDIAPQRPLEDTFLLGLIDALVVIQPVWHTGIVFALPINRGNSLERD